MNTFIYADFDLNGFTTDDKVFGNYTGGTNNYAGTYTFTIPANQASGTYRVRYKVDWDDQDPCIYGQSAKDNGEVVIDFNIIIPKTTLEEARTVTVESENEAYGTVAFTSPATEGNTVTTDEKTVTVKATPAEGMTFMNWTNSADEVVATTATYNYTGETDETLTAHFGYSVDYTVGAGGNAIVYADGTAIASGIVVVPGAEITININPNSGNEALVKLNGSYIQFEGNTYSFTAEANVTINIEFAEHVNHVEFIVSGNGRIEMFEGYDPDNENLPYGSQLTNGAALPAFDQNVDDNMTLYSVFFIPEDGESVLNANVTINGTEYSVFELLENGEYGGASSMFCYISKEDIDGDVVITASFTSDSQGIDEIGIDEANGPVEYYNLQGVRVASENLVPGFYIVRQGSKTAKVLIRK